MTEVLLLNGGGLPRSNYVSHVRHLARLRDVARLRGIGEAEITTLASDGTSPRPDVVQVAVPSSSDAWLLEGTTIAKALGRPKLYGSTNLPGIVEPAGRAQLERWLDDAKAELHAGDTILVFVTDHGLKGKSPEKNQILLWNRDTISAEELAAELDGLDPGVRVITVMGQCHSGGFAELAFPRAGSKRRVGSTCGFFSTTAARRAYGCYRESLSVEDGYLFALVAALEVTGELGAAHGRTGVLDRTPDVPIKTSDVYLERVLERTAKEQQTSVDALVNELLPDGLEPGQASTDAYDAIAASFALPVSTSPKALEALAAKLERLSHRLGEASELWSLATGELAEAHLDELIAERPEWVPRLRPTAIARLQPAELEKLQLELPTLLAKRLAAHESRESLLRAGHFRKVAVDAAAWRSEVRAAAAARLRTIRVSEAGRRLIARKAAPAEMAELAALESCERYTFPIARPLGPATNDPARFPPMESDERALETQAPASIGATLAPLPDRLRAGMPDGAMWVRGIASKSPAAEAGLLAGDIVLGTEGHRIEERGALRLHLASLTGPEPKTLEVSRFGDRKLLTVKPTIDAIAVEADALPAAERRSLASLEMHHGELPEIGGGKPVMLFFWATWCRWCKEAIPELTTLEDEKGVNVVAITEEEPRVVNAFVGERRGRFPANVALDRDHVVNEAFAVSGYPTFVLIDADGRVTMRAVGYDPEQGLPRAGKERFDEE